MGIRTLALAALTVAACGSKGSAPPAGSPPAGEAGSATGDAGAPDALAGWRANLALLASELPRRHPAPFARTGEDAFRAAVGELDRALPSLTDDQRVVGLARVVALLGDSHTQLDLGRFGRVAVYPFSATWFADGLYVTDAAPAHAAAVGKRLVTVGDRPIEEAIDVLSTTFGWDTESYRRAQLPWRLTWPQFVRGTGLAPADGPARFGLVDAAGARHELVVEPQRWKPTAPDPATAPLYRQKPGSFYWSRYLDGPRALYVQYNRCAEAPDLSFADFTRHLAGVLDQQPVERLIVDLRWNGGGDSRIMKPLLELLAARPALTSRLFVLIGRHTFSSGLFNAVDLDRLGAVLVGEPAGAAGHHFGEVRQLELPAHGLSVYHSTRRFELPGTSDAALAPDVAVDLTAADFFAGRDPVLDAALAYRTR